VSKRARRNGDRLQDSKSDIALQLTGGLGNQLFQLAFARRLAEDGHTITLDRHSQDSPLGSLAEKFPTVRFNPPAMKLARRLQSSRTHTGRIRVSERTFRFDPAIFDLVARGGRFYLEGYWQSPNYFESDNERLADDVRQELETRLTPQGHDMLRNVQSEPRVASVHVRRGDYLNPKTANHHGVLDMGYYRRAMDFMRGRGVTHFCVFSDDLGFARDQFEHPDVSVVPHDVGQDPGAEILLMAACTDHVIANSSFSWWGAWLSRTGPKATVVAPARWFAAPHIDAADLVPEGWIRFE
jgi:hypothetical protein